MTSSQKRNPIACDRCRSMRRLCQPPFPCARCIKANVVCHLREKARPSRSRSVALQAQLSMPSAELVTLPDARAPCSSPVYQLSDVSTQSRSHSHVPEALFSLVTSIAKARYDHDICFNLAEPSPQIGPTSMVCRMRGHEASRIFSENDISITLGAFFCHKLTLSRILNHSTLIDHVRVFFQNQDTATFDSDDLVRLTTIAPDLSAVLLALLALLTRTQSPCVCVPQHLFDQATGAVNSITGPPTLSTVVALYFLHLFAIGNRTTNHAKALLSQAVLTFKDLDLDDISNPVDRCSARWLYLTIMFADLYTATTYISSRPLIPVADINHSLLEALQADEPSTKVLIGILTLQKEISDEFPQKTFDSQWVAIVEEKMSAFMERSAFSMDLYTKNADIAVEERLSRIYLSWLRITIWGNQLEGARSLESMCICIRAAQTILSNYLHILRPESRSQLLPLTWRQAIRIVTCGCIIIIGYWRGEVTDTEATRELSTAIQLLDLLRGRWGAAMTRIIGVLRTLIDISNLVSEPMGFDGSSLAKLGHQRISHYDSIQDPAQAGVMESSSNSFEVRYGPGILSEDWFMDLGLSPHMFSFES